MPVWGTLFVTVSEYEPAANPAGSVATSFWFVNDTRASAYSDDADHSFRFDGDHYSE